MKRLSLAVGLLSLVELWPFVWFAFLGGALADARDRRTILLLTALFLPPPEDYNCCALGQRGFR